MNLKKFQWTREPREYNVFEDTIEIITKPHTDLWQKTYQKIHLLRQFFQN